MGAKPAPGSAAGAAPAVIFAYASQTGTASEIARGLQAEAASEHKIKSEALSLNELGFGTLAGRGPLLLVLVAASTGDGDPPDNSANFWVQMKRRTEAAGGGDGSGGAPLKDVRFTCMGLGDSNYTRFMHVPRTLCSRCGEQSPLPPIHPCVGGGDAQVLAGGKGGREERGWPHTRVSEVQPPGRAG